MTFERAQAECGTNAWFLKRPTSVRRSVGEKCVEAALRCVGFQTGKVLWKRLVSPVSEAWRRTQSGADPRHSRCHACHGVLHRCVPQGGLFDAVLPSRSSLSTSAFSGADGLGAYLS